MTERQRRARTAEPVSSPSSPRHTPGAARPPPVLLVVLGHPDRGDDAAPTRVLEMLRPDLPLTLTLLERPADAATLLLALQAAALTIAIDTLRWPDKPCGHIALLDADNLTAGGRAPLASSHGDALGGALALARALGPWPPALHLHGIVGRRFALGSPLSPAVQAALPRAAADVRRDLHRAMTARVDTA